MESEKTGRQKLIESLYDANRHLSTWTVMLHHAIAEQIGLNITDHKCLDILNDRGAMTAGQLSEISGLTTGAVTGVIDRLERNGYVRRERDPNDRRCVIVQPVAETANRNLGPIFERLLERYNPLLEQYSENDLRSVLRFIENSVLFIQDEIAQLREETKGKI
jgi:DNA-binding MarR family transcriptional regulator